jgi:hypothetical protein
MAHRLAKATAGAFTAKDRSTNDAIKFPPSGCSSYEASDARLVRLQPDDGSDMQIVRIRLVWGFLCQWGDHAIFVFLCHSILLFDPRRGHSSAPTAYFHRRRAQRWSRTALLQRRRRLVLDGREHGGRLPAIGWLAAR